MKKGLCSILAIVITAVLALSGCSGSSQAQTNNTGDKTPANTTFTLWSLSSGHTDFFKNASAEWNKDHPDEQITLNITTMNTDDLANKLLVAFSANSGAPDFADLEAVHFQSFMKGSTVHLVDLTSLVEDDKSAFVKPKLDIYSRDGKLYGIDYQAGTTVAFYNQDIFKQAGVDPMSIHSWDDFIAAGKTIKAKTGKLMWYVSQGLDRELELLVGQQGSDYFDSKGNVTLDNPANIKALQMLHDMIYVDKIAAVAPGNSTDTEQAYGAIDKGNVASVLMPMYYTSRFTNNMPDLKGKMLIQAPPAFPDAQYKTVVAGGTGTSVTDQCKNIPLAKQFLEYAKATKEASVNDWNILGCDPPRSDVWNTVAGNMDPNNKYVQYFANGKDIFTVLGSLKDSMTVITNTPMTPTLTNLLQSEALYKVLAKDSATPQDALKSVADEVRKQMQ
jgi:ABC-type sugar transport system, periplasmic component